MKKSLFQRTVSVFVALTLIASYMLSISASADTGSQSKDSSIKDNEVTNYIEGIKYADVLNDLDLNKQYNAQEIRLGAEKLDTRDGIEKDIIELAGRKFIKWDENIDNLSAVFEAKAGLYIIEIEYKTDSSNTADIIRGVKIDGVYPYFEAQNVLIPRIWKPDGDRFVDAMGDERPAGLIQDESIRTSQFVDLYGMYSEPLVFQLSEGQHKIDIEMISGFMDVSSIKLVPYQPAISYEEYLSSNHADMYEGEPLLYEGENVSNISDRTISFQAMNNTTMSPFRIGKKTINALGGWSWRNGNAEATWEIDVPQTGYYKIVVRNAQDYNGLATYRKILIDHEVPFNEMYEYPFYAHKGYKSEAIGGDEPYLFYLTKGSHTITMTAVVGPSREVINGFQTLSNDISYIVRKIQTITGTNPDPNFDYELGKKIPGLLDELTTYANGIEDNIMLLEDICKTPPSIKGGVMADVEKIRGMVKKPRQIPNKLADLMEIQTRLADYSSQLKDAPLSIDFLQLAPADYQIKQVKSSLWSKLTLVVVDFLNSFRNYDDLIDNGDTKTQVLNVWMSKGRDWGELVQRMADEDFTPKTGIKIKLNILAAGSTGIIGAGASPLMLSIVSGNEPDIALGSDMDTPIELAIRNAGQDLSEFEGFDELMSRFNPEAVVPFEYNDGVYALPETMDFPVMIYRKDILDDIGVEPPQTWEELWRFTLPKLKQINANFFVNATAIGGSNTSKMAMYATFLFQNGGSFYKENGMSNLDTPEAFKAFSQYTDCVLRYQSPRSANFYNEMRMGTIPIGIGYMSDYLMLDVAAPELQGRLGIAAIPGVMNENGEVERYCAGSVTSAVMFASSDKKEAAWKFLDWWTSDEIQQRFASEIVAKVGPTARWYSANLSALYSLPWGKDRLDTIKETLDWYKNPSNTLGGYMTSRSVNNAWTRTVMSNMNARDSLEQAVAEINIEVEKKREEYGVK